MTNRPVIAVAALTGALVASAAACGRSPHRVVSADGRCSVRCCQPLLDAAAQGFARVLDTSFPDRVVRTVATAVGPASEVRTKPAPKPLPRSVIVAARFHALSDGFCEVSLFGPHTENEVAEYFDSVQLSPSARAR